MEQASFEILVVEDTPIQAKKLQFYLEKFGHRVTLAENGRKAFEFLRARGDEFDIIISDIQMPEMDGLALLAAVKSVESLRRIPLIVLTTLEEASVRMDALELGATEILQKPFVPEELKLRVRNVGALREFQKTIINENSVLAESLEEKNRVLEESLEELRETHEQLMQMQAQLILASKMQSLGVMSAGIAHEVNNPLAIIAGLNDLIRQQINRDDFDRAKVAELNAKIDKSVGRISGVIQHLRDFSQQGTAEGRLEVIVLGTLVTNLGDFYAKRAAAYGVDVQLAIPAQPLEVLANKVGLEQSMLNLINNAIDAMSELPPGRERLLQIQVVDLGDKAELRVVDHGSGIPEKDRDKLFEPFFTTKAPNKGMGIGLSLVYSFLKRMRAEIRFETSLEGTTFIVTLLKRKNMN